nr:SLBB domain-containing protein [Bacillus pumilus]
MKEDKDIQVTLEDKQEKTDNESSPIFVEVKGAVKKPGVYTFQFDARVEEAIRRAGGFTSKADTIEINQANKIRGQYDDLCPEAGRSGEADANSNR